tara:strand:+ start:225 stop:542 length:318 start_codon:yes stop_codon:yes gene_type:complete
MDDIVPVLRVTGYSKDDPQWLSDLLKMEFAIDYEEYQKEEVIKRRNTWKKPDCLHEKYLCTGKLKFLIGPDTDGYMEFWVLDKDAPNNHVIENYIPNYDAVVNGD